jgi:hypothetical protein
MDRAATMRRLLTNIMSSFQTKSSIKEVSSEEDLTLSKY